MNGRWILAAIDDHVTALTQHTTMRIHDGNADIGVQDIRLRLSDPDVPREKKDLYLRALIRRSQDEGGGGMWTLAAVGVMLPGLRRITRHMIRYERAEPADAASEALASFLQALRTADPGVDDVQERLYRTTSRATAKALRRPRESAVADIELVGALRAGHDPSDAIAESVLREQRAGLRVLPSSRRQVEGERIGALLHTLGIRENTGPLTRRADRAPWN